VRDSAQQYRRRFGFAIAPGTVNAAIRRSDGQVKNSQIETHGQAWRKNAIKMAAGGETGFQSGPPSCGKNIKKADRVRVG
jgi:hypothetical protein